jgi:hypothetical protein
MTTVIPINQITVLADPITELFVPSSSLLLLLLLCELSCNSILGQISKL